MAKKPKAPTGLTVTRKENQYTVTWKRATSYTAQELYYTVNDGDKNYISIAKNTTSKAITINKADYYPKSKDGVANPKITNLSFHVRGKKNKKWSDVTTKQYTIKVPPKPKLSAAHSNDHENVTNFTWSIDWDEENTSTETATNKDTSSAIFTNFQWWTSLLANSDVDSDKVTTWQSTGTTTDNVVNSDKSIDEGNTFTGNYSYTRYFKLVAKGPAGDSSPVYEKHVYAFPNAPVNVKASAVKLESNIGYRVSVQWSANETKSRPIDSVSLEYAIAKPATSRTVPSQNSGTVKTTWSVPNISSWSTAATLKDTSNTTGDMTGSSFVIDRNLDDDECIFVRVVTKHDNKTSPSAVVFVDGGYGYVAAPSNLSASINSSNVATISVNQNSELTAAFIGIYYRTNLDQNPKLVGIWPSGRSSAITVQLPDPGDASTVSLGARAFLADYSPYLSSTVTNYAISNIKMSSEGIIWDESAVPKPPANIGLSSPRTGVVRVTWDWSWLTANGAEISWANHDDAWESTDEPSTYVLENTRASAWNIAGLDVGTWYFKIRLFKTEGDAVTYGTYSDMKSIKLASSPATPVLTLSPSIVEPNGKVTCYWAFTATDGDEQVQADICEATLSDTGTATYGTIVAKANNEQYKTIDIASLGWAAGSKHYLSVKVITASGEESNNWSVPKPIQILDPITCTITSTSLEEITVVDDEEQSISHTQLSLTEMPLEVSATGAGKSGTMTYILERAYDYHMDRPDETEITGFQGETIAILQRQPTNIYSRSNDRTVQSSKQYYTKSGDEYTAVTPASGANPYSLNYYEISSYNYDAVFTMDDLIGPLDDGAPYNIIAIAQDSYGQTASAAKTFDVHWSHQAVMPSATIEVDPEELVTYITPIQPTGYAPGDTCDIYRLSADRPELIVRNAEFGTKYVDLYPTLGIMGGHRIVYRTANGDYITEDNEFAWADYGEETGDVLDTFATIIDFGDDQVVLPYDLSLSNSWAKDFTKTKYLGGSIQGDWNPAVERTGSIKGRVAVKHDSDLVRSIRTLADYAGICHVRTPDGSSYAANVDVTEDREEKKINMITKFSFNIDRVDSQSLDGMLYDDWINDSEE